MFLCGKTKIEERVEKLEKQLASVVQTANSALKQIRTEQSKTKRQLNSLDDTLTEALALGEETLHQIQSRHLAKPEDKEEEPTEAEDGNRSD